MAGGGGSSKSPGAYGIDLIICRPYSIYNDAGAAAAAGAGVYGQRVSWYRCRLCIRKILQSHGRSGGDKLTPRQPNDARKFIFLYLFLYFQTLF